MRFVLRSFASAFVRITPVAALCVAVAACGGGGGGGATASPAGIIPSVAGSTPGPQTASGVSAPATFSVSFEQYTPVQTTANARHAAFVSPATLSMTMAVVSLNGTAVINGASSTFNVGAGSQNCASAGAITTCNVGLTVPVGNVVLSARSFSGLAGAGTTLGSALVPASIALNASNRIALALSGTIATLQLYVSTTSFSTGVPAAALAVIVPLDSSGAQIVNPGAYNPAVVVTSTDLSGHFSLILNGTNVGRTATVVSPNDQIVVNYDGVGAPSSTIKATAGTPSSSVNVHAGLPALGGTIAGNTSSTPKHFQFTSLGQTGTITSTGGTGPYTVTTTDATVASVTPAAGAGPFTVTATGFGTAGTGTATLTVTDSAAATVTFSVTVVPLPIAIAVNACGIQATCTPAMITFPRSPAGGPGTQETGTIGLSGGNGTYTYTFATSGSTTSSYANVAGAGATYTITPTGAGNDALVIKSGSQTALYPIVTSNPFAALFPTAFGLRVGPASTSPALTNTATTANVSTGTLASFVFAPGSPASFTAMPTLGDSPLGALTFHNVGGDVAIVPFELFTVALGAFNGATNNATADEAFTAVGQTDSVTIGHIQGVLTAVSTNSTVVGASIGATVAGSATISLTAAGTGTAGVTFTDTTIGASVTLNVSVTTSIIPISSRLRAP